MELGTVRVSFSVTQEESAFFDLLSENGEDLGDISNEESPVIFINTGIILIGLGVIAGLALIVLLAHIILKNYNLSFRRPHRHRRRRRRKRK